MDSAPKVVLLGTGHAHLQVLQGLSRLNLHLTLISCEDVAVYSGMIPGVICREYRPEEAMVELRPLAEEYGVELIVKKAVGVEPEGKKVLLEGGEEVGFDVLSVNIGSKTKGSGIPGADEYCLATRPLLHLIQAIEALDHMSSPPLISILGAGAAGIELALSLHSRLSPLFPSLSITLLDSHPQLLPALPVSLSHTLSTLFTDLNIQLLLSTTVTSISSTHILLSTGQTLPSNVTILATGAEMHPISLNLPVSDSGFMLINRYLQSIQYDYIFGAGDCVSFIDFPSNFPPKAGVYSVREGPILTQNIRNYIQKRDLVTFTPQNDFLMILNLGNGQALGTKYGYFFRNSMVRRLKNSIDRKFMRKFQVRRRENEGKCGIL